MSVTTYFHTLYGQITKIDALRFVSVGFLNSLLVNFRAQLLVRRRGGSGKKEPGVGDGDSVSSSLKFLVAEIAKS